MKILGKAAFPRRGRKEFRPSLQLKKGGRIKVSPLPHWRTHHCSWGINALLMQC